MGACCSKSSADYSFITTLDPEDWTQSNVSIWLKSSCNGELSDLTTPFSKQKISGLSFVKLTVDDLKSFGISQIGLREQFVYERDKLLKEFKNLKKINSQKHLKTNTSKHIQINSQTFNSSDVRHVNTPTVDVNDEEIRLMNDESEIYGSEPISPPTPTPNASIRASILSDNIPISKIQTFEPQTTNIMDKKALNTNIITTAKSTETFWISMDYDEINKVFDMYNIKRTLSIYNIYDLNELQQYDKYSYVNYHRIVVDSFIRLNEILLNKHYGQKYNNSVILIPSIINEICNQYYFDYEIGIVQFAYNVYLILDQIEESRFINSLWIPSFNGNTFVNCIKDKYKHKSTIFIKKYCSYLLQYEYIELFAKIDDDEIFGDTRLVLSALLHPILDTTHEFSNDSDSIIGAEHLFKFNKNIRLLFDKYKYFQQYKLDRNAWRIGTKIKIYSSSYGEWKFGEIYQIETDGHIMVTYGDINNKFKKKLHINVDTIKSTNIFISNRNKWDTGSNIEIFVHNVWYYGKIVEKIYHNGYVQDIFKVNYYKNDGKLEVFTKLVERWSADIRDIPIVISKTLQKYKSGVKIKIYSNTKQCWLIGKVKNVVYDSEMINIIYGKNNEWEKTVHVNSNQIQWINQ
eukprot:224009_1